MAMMSAAVMVNIVLLRGDELLLRIECSNRRANTDFVAAQQFSPARVPNPSRIEKHFTIIAFCSLPRSHGVGRHCRRQRT